MKMLGEQNGGRGGKGCGCGMRGGSGSHWRHNFYAQKWDGSTPPGALCNQTNTLDNNDAILGCRGGGKKKRTSKRKNSRKNKKSKKSISLLNRLYRTVNKKK